MNNNAYKFTDLSGRILLAAIFLISGLHKIADYGTTAGYMQSAGVPGALLPAVIALEIGGAVAVILGFMTRWAALGLAAFSIAAAVLFHGNVGEQQQFIAFFKNLAIAGGFMILAVNGAGPLSIDARRRS